MLDQNKLRNLIAYKCFGVDSTSKFAVNPFTTNLEKYGLLDSLRPTWLTECEVPLAILYWTLVDGIKFIDLWSVRRRLARRLADKTWSFLTSERNTREGEAMYLQFQSQLKDLAASGVITSQVKARDHFKYLPAAGLLPVGGAGGFDYSHFLQRNHDSSTDLYRRRTAALVVSGVFRLSTGRYRQRACLLPVHRARERAVVARRSIVNADVCGVREWPHALSRRGAL